MSHLNYIREKLIEYEKEVENLPFEQNDLRKGYFEHIRTTLHLYYKDFCWMTLISHINSGNVQFDLETTQDFMPHLDFLSSTTRHEYSFYNSRNRANRSLLTESWSNFEFALTYIADKIFDDTTKEKLLSFDSAEVLRITSSYNISEGHILKINNLFKRKHLTHVPVTRKYNKLYSIYKENFKGNLNADRAFLDFFGKYRNGLHTNYIYHGNDFIYNHNGVEYRFFNGQSVTHNIQLDFRHHFDLVIELKNVCLRLFNSIKTDIVLDAPLEG